MHIWSGLSATNCVFQLSIDPRSSRGPDHNALEMQLAYLALALT
jgi:hypothetical protein